MKEESKYYTPTIEEFRVGFKYEVQQQEEQYGQCVYGNIYEPTRHELGDNIDLNHVRVKLLDREDIEELGFTHIGALWFENKELDCRIRKWKDLELDIYKNWSTNDGNISDMCKVFAGKIKNKSELQQILKMVL